MNDNLNAEGCGVIWGNHSFVVTLHDGIAAAMSDPQAELRTVEGSLVEEPISVRRSLRVGAETVG